METFFKYFFADVGRIFRSFIDIFAAFFQFVNYLFNFPMRYRLIREYAPDFSVWEWILVVITEIILLAVAVLIVILVIKALRKLFRFRVPVKKYEEMEKQVKSLQRELLRANYEKDRLMNMRLAELGAGQTPPEEEEENGEEKEKTEAGEEEGKKEEEVEGGETAAVSARNTFISPPVDPETSRFYRLTSVDNYYKTEYVPPIYEDNFTLSELCERFRNFTASQLKLYYDLDMMRHFIASMGTTRIIILQGISGTGKTSLPYAFGRFVGLDTTVVSVQPSWRERTELYGYFNEFTKKYNETDFLRAIYEANYYRDPHIIILDEMNIARVEYYFAEMLSILELPLKDEWKIDVVNATWDNDPCLITNGKIAIPDNVWFVGTINNDDSTFAVADKVYDRAIPIDLDSRAEPFTCPATDGMRFSADRMFALFDEAKKKYPVSDQILEKMEQTNTYLINNFRLAFGNRIFKQLHEYVPCYIACGGTELRAADFILAKKVLRKLESLSLGYTKEELTKLSAFLDRTFGKNSMNISKSYIEYLKKNN